MKKLKAVCLAIAVVLGLRRMRSPGATLSARPQAQGYLNCSRFTFPISMVAETLLATRYDFRRYSMLFRRAYDNTLVLSSGDNLIPEP